jgi:hypothetical protein
MRPDALLFALTLGLLAPACQPPGDDDPVGDDDDSTGAEPTLYRFDSRLGDGTDTVANSGQILRHVLIEDMKNRIGGMTARLDGGWFPAEGEVAGELSFYFDFDSDSSGEIPHGIDSEPPALQETYDDISSDKDLVGKLAGNDPVGQHADWSTDFVGWSLPGTTSPEALVRAWFDQLDAQARGWANGTYPLDPSGAPVAAVFITADGTDLQQLLQKFLLGAVAFSQGVDDYLDDDTAGKGLLSDHDALEDGENFTALEHAWDEAFGYFGASRDYVTWTDEQIATLRGRDTVQVDGALDLTREVVWGHSQNAAKRDLCGGCAAPPDLTRRAWDAFHAGRAYIASRDATLTPDEVSELAAFRDEAVSAWEEAIAATVVHYINELRGDLAGDPVGSFSNVAKHWSEMKGFALSLQFNRLSPLSKARFAELHDLLGQAPGLATPDDYATALLEARALLGEAYGWDGGNLDAW